VTSTASIGVATSRLDHDDAADVIRAADEAMYEAKADGRATWRIFDGAMEERSRARLDLERALRRATPAEDFDIVWNPVHDLRSGHLVGLCAALCWHPEGRDEPVAPADFMPLAEETGIILPVGRHLLESACRRVVEWSHRFPAAASDVILHVPLSKRQLAHPEIVETIATVLEQTGLDPHRLRLDVTETAVLDDRSDLMPVMEQLLDLGVEFALDDFGTGHSSLSCLHRFPISTLKIDRGFIRRMNERRSFAAVVQSIITLADNLGLVTIAEGIENEAHLAACQALSCPNGQGAWFGRRLGTETVAARLADSAATREPSARAG